MIFLMIGSQPSSRRRSFVLDSEFTELGCHAISALSFRLSALSFRLGALPFGISALSFGLGAFCKLLMGGKWRLIRADDP
jgi:hypothetical protein